MNRSVETDANRGRTRGRGEVDDDQEGVPEYLKCVVCLGEGGDLISSRARGPKRVRVPLEQIYTRVIKLFTSMRGSGRKHSCWHPPRSPRYGRIMCERARCIHTCTLLTEAPRGRIEQCTNGHLLCSEDGDGDGTSCASRVRAVRGPKCPVCRHGLPSTSIRALSAEQTIAALPGRCCHCSSSMQRGSLRAHEEVCPRAPVLCTAEDGGCRWTGPRAEQDTHEATCMWGRAEARRVRTQTLRLRDHHALSILFRQGYQSAPQMKKDQHKSVILNPKS